MVLVSWLMFALLFGRFSGPSSWKITGVCMRVWVYMYMHVCVCVHNLYVCC